MDLDFSESYKQTNISLLSPNSQFIAIVVDFRLIIRSCQTLSILHLFSCTDLISCIQWSPDSNLIACASLKLGNIHIWSLSDPKFSCSINEGVAGLSKMFFGDCRHLLTIDDFALRITVWSLIDGSCNYIQFPKYIEKGYCFRCDSQYFAVVERRDCKDLVNVYNTADQWSLEKEWTVDTFDLADICWSPDGRYIAAWESVLFKVLLYYPDGRLVSVYEVDSGLGIKSVQWSPSAQFLAIASSDQKVRLLNNYTWNASIEFTHTSNFDKNVTIYKQIDNHKPEANNRWSQPYDSTKKTCILKVNLDEKAVLFNQKVLSHKFGVSILEFNSNGKYIATRTESLPNILFIWDLTTLKYQLIAHDENTIVKNIKWNPTRPDLLLFLVDSCDDYLFFWNGEHGASAVEVPGGFKITSSEWSADGGAVLVGDSTKFCIAVVLDDC